MLVRTIRVPAVPENVGSNVSASSNADTTTSPPAVGPAALGSDDGEAALVGAPLAGADADGVLVAQPTTTRLTKIAARPRFHRATGAPSSDSRAIDCACNRLHVDHSIGVNVLVATEWGPVREWGPGSPAGCG